MRTDGIAREVRELRNRLAEAYGPRLHQVIVFGSHARGTDLSDSDIDVLVVLDRVDRYWDELERTAEPVARASSRMGTTVNVSFVPAEEWERQDSVFLRDIREHGIAA